MRAAPPATSTILSNPRRGRWFISRVPKSAGHWGQDDTNSREHRFAARDPADRNDRDRHRRHALSRRRRDGAAFRRSLWLVARRCDICADDQQHRASHHQHRDRLARRPVFGARDRSAGDSGILIGDRAAGACGSDPVELVRGLFCVQHPLRRCEQYNLDQAGGDEFQQAARSCSCRFSCRRGYIRQHHTGHHFGAT